TTTTTTTTASPATTATTPSAAPVHTASVRRAERRAPAAGGREAGPTSRALPGGAGRPSLLASPSRTGHRAAAPGRLATPRDRAREPRRQPRPALAAQ